jgi:putative ABC transport system ATP-binding protein
MTTLEIKNLSKTYATNKGGVEVLRDNNLTLKSGIIHAIMGPSGCGKSTLLMIAGALLEASQGEVLIDGENLLGMSSRERANRRTQLVGYVFQAFHLIPYLNTCQNILVAGTHCPTKDDRHRAEALMERFGLSHRVNHVPSHLSQGEQQRVALARALFNSPKVLITDEPTGNLDEENSKLVLSAFRDFANDGGLVLIATHSNDVADFADNVYTYEDKKLVEVGGKIA